MIRKKTRWNSKSLSKSHSSDNLHSVSLGMKILFLFMAVVVIGLIYTTSFSAITGASIGLGVENDNLIIELPEIDDRILPEENKSESLPEDNSSETYLPGEELTINNTDEKLEDFPEILLPVEDSANEGFNESSENETASLQPEFNILALPVISSVILNTTDMTTNNTDVNLTANVTSSDSDGDPIRHIFNWLVNNTAGPGKSITVLNMPFERINGTTTNNAYDYSGYGNNGSEISGISWNQTGGHNKSGAYSFDGVDDYISVASSGTLHQIRNNITVSFWTKNDVTPAQWDMLISRTTSTSWADGWGVFYDSGTAVNFFVGHWSNNVATATSTPTKWNHIVGTYDGNNIRIYVNGVEGTADSVTSDDLTTPSEVDLEIGRGAADAYNFDGHLDELMIFNRSLSIEQIKALYNNRTDIIVFKEITSGQNWTVDVTPNDGSEDGAKVRSNQVIILSNSVPIISSVIVNTTDMTTNNTDVNLTANVTSSDADGDSIMHIYNWLVNDSAGPGKSITVLNIPFERVNGTDSNNAYDYSGYGRNGSEKNGALWGSSSGYDGKGAYTFDGTNDEITITPDSNLLLLGNFSIAAWIKMDLLPTTAFPEYIDSIIDSRRIADPFDGWGFHVEGVNGTAGTLSFRDWAGGGGTVNANSLITTNAWTHVAVTFNDATREITFYINGSLNKVNSSYVFNPPTTLPEQILIGRSPGSAEYEFDGVIDELVIFNRTLTATQINALFNNRTDLISFNETTSGQNWTVDVTPNAGSEEDAKVRSNQVIILDQNNKPTISSVILNTTDLTTNNTDVNLTANVTSSDADGDSIKHIYNWLVNGTSIAVLNMPFERINGTDVSNAWDYSGYGNNGTENGSITWNATAGHDSRGAYDFDGVNDYLNISLKNNLNITKTITIAAWIKAKSLKTGGIVAHWKTPEYPFILWMNSAGNISWVVNNSNYVYTRIVDSDKWYHVAGVYNGTDVAIYMNGSRIATKPQIGNIATISGDYLIGGYTNSDGAPDTFFNGTIDDVMIFNRSLSASQIWNLYQNRSDMMSFEDTTSGQNWTVDVTPNDGNEDGAVVRSNQVIILGEAAVNSKPIISSVILNTTDLTLNNTDVNLTANVTSSDADSDSIKHIYNWLVNGTSIAVLNMPFEKINNTETQNAWDYSSYRINATVNGTTDFWNSTGGHDGLGAYKFNGSGSGAIIDLGNLSNGSVFRQTNAITYTFWAKLTSSGSGGNVMGAGTAGGHGFGGVSMTSTSATFKWTPAINSDRALQNTSVKINTDKWVHVAFAIDFANRNASLYLNGSRYELIPSADTGADWRPTSSYSNGKNDSIGGRFVNSYAFFNGII